MSRYTGPRLKVMRALGTELPGLSRKPLGERAYPPGQHGRRPQRKSGFGVQLIEKQKLRFNYGLTEKQMQRLMREAKRDRGPTGDKLVELLERRLDNLVFRAGFAPTAVAARQLVRHKHVLLNGRTVNIASIRIKPGDRIQLSERGRRIPLVLESVVEPALTRPEWIAVDEASFVATVTRTPSPDEVPFPIDVQQVVEYYAVRL